MGSKNVGPKLAQKDPERTPNGSQTDPERSPNGLVAEFSIRIFSETRLLWKQQHPISCNEEFPGGAPRLYRPLGKKGLRPPPPRRSVRFSGGATDGGRPHFVCCPGVVNSVWEFILAGSRRHSHVMPLSNRRARSSMHHRLRLVA